MPSMAPPLRPVQTPRPPQVRRLRAPLQTDGPTPPSLLHSPLLNATTRGPAIYPTNLPATSQPRLRRSDNASSTSPPVRARSHSSAMSTSASSLSAASNPIAGTISPHAQRSRFSFSTEPHPSPSSYHHTRTSSRSSPTVTSATHLGGFDDDPWRILDTVPALPYRGYSQTATLTVSTLPHAQAAIMTATTTTVPPGARDYYIHVPRPTVSCHSQISTSIPAEISSQQQTHTPTRRLGAGTTQLVSTGVGNSTIQDPNPTNALRSRPHSSP